MVNDDITSGVEETECCNQQTLLHNECADVSVQTSVPAGMQPDALCNAPTRTQLGGMNFSLDIRPSVCLLCWKTSYLKLREFFFVSQ